MTPSQGVISPNSAPLSWPDRLARRVVIRHLENLRRGRLTVIEADGQSVFGEPADLDATLAIHRARFFRKAVLGGSLALAESYLRSDWDCDDLTRLLRIFARNRTTAYRFDSGFARLTRWVQQLGHWCRANTRRRSRSNISAHYDLGNDFFRLWLDDTMAYSSGIFVSPASSLHDASIEKFDRVCRKLDIRVGDRVLEIGTGWGGFAMHAAANYGCHVTTTTISREQFHVANDRIHRAGLAGQVTLLQQDYRDLRGQYDKLVSIEMIEAVGHQYLDAYFRQCSQLLRPDGSMLLQAIVMPEQGYEQYIRSVDFIQHYIFPGGCLPSLGTILAAIGRVSDLRFRQAEDYASHYAETLRCWRRNFHEQQDVIMRLGYPERFMRMWHYYLCYCEAAFEERCTGVLQIQFDKPERRPAAIEIRHRGASQSLYAEPTRPPRSWVEHTSSSQGV